MSDCCRWRQDDEGTWETECGNAFVVNEGTPSENGMAFCCYCGKPLVDAEDPDDE